MERAVFIRFGLYLAVTFFSEAGACATHIEGKVVHIDDGDTVIMMTADYIKVTVRLSDIDAPEGSHGERRPGQPFSSLSTQSLRGLVGGHQVGAECYESDRYGRQVCKLVVDGLNVNAEQVRRGMAWANHANPRYVRDRSIFEVERTAQSQRIGLWGASRTPVAPWIWRRLCWQLKECSDADE